MTTQTASTKMNHLSVTLPSPQFDYVTAPNTSLYFGREDISGRFSLVDGGPMHIQIEAGAVLHVRAGSVQVAQLADKDEQFVAEGQYLVAKRDGLLTVRSRSRAQLQIDWPIARSNAAFAPAYTN